MSAPRGEVELLARVPRVTRGCSRRGFFMRCREHAVEGPDTSARFSESSASLALSLAGLPYTTTIAFSCGLWVARCERCASRTSSEESCYWRIASASATAVEKLSLPNLTTTSLLFQALAFRAQSTQLKYAPNEDREQRDG